MSRSASQVVYVPSRFKTGACGGYVFSNKVTAWSYSTNCVSHRAKPRVLDSTYLFLTRTRNNTASYVSPGCGCFRDGWIQDTYGCWVVENHDFAPPRNSPSDTLVKARSRLAESSVNVLTNLWEAKDTGRQMTNLAVRVASVAVALGTGNLRRAEQLAEASLSRKEFSRLKHMTPFQRVNNAYLEVNLGLKPMIEDFHGIAEHMNQKFTIGSTAMGKASAYPTPGKRPDTFTGTGEPTVEQLTAWNTARTGGLVSNPYARSLADLGLLNPLSAGYDAIPLSFVLDYFLNVGGYLRGLTAGAGLTSTYQSQTTRTGGWHRSSKSPKPWWDFYEYIVRSPSNFDVLLPPTISPGFTPTANRLMNLVSLSIQRLDNIKAYNGRHATL